MIAAPVLFFLALEGALRLTGYGRDTAFFIPDDKPGFLRTNPEYTSLFLPAGFDLRPINARVAEKKPAGTIRIVVLGESAAQGIPAPAFAFVPQLRALLRARYPDKQFEIINTGVVAINSHVVYQIARDAARLSPDLFLVYMGNNEVVGPYGPGCSYLSAMPPLWVIRASVWAKTTRTGELLASVIGRLSGRNRSARPWGGMGMFLDHAVRGDDPRLEATYRNFEANLRDILGRAQSAGAKTVLCSVVANLQDCAPFLSLHRPGLDGADLAAWQTAFDEGRLAWKLGENAAARTHLVEAWRLDPQYADTAFMLGSLEQQANNLPAARAHYLEAQAWDALRFRPAPRLNELARAAARGNPDVTFVDAALELGSDPSSSGPITGRDLMYEHVHPNWEGNYRIAKLLAEGVEQALFSAAAGRRPWLDSRSTASAVGYTLHERFGALQRAALITREPPFPNQLTYAEDQGSTDEALRWFHRQGRETLALRQAYAETQAAIAADPENPELEKIAAEQADDLNDLEGALAHVQRAAQLQPWNFALAGDEAIKLARLGRVQQAEDLLFATAARCNRRDLEKLTPAVADLFMRTKRPEPGRRWFDDALVKYPDSLPLRFFRGQMARAANDWGTAEADWKAVLAAEPGNESALDALANLLQALGKVREAEDLLLSHAPLQPNNQANHLRVAQIYERRGQPAESATALLAASRSGPVDVAVHLRLANFFYGQQRRTEALDQLATAWRRASSTDGVGGTDEIREIIRRMRAGAPRP